MTDPAPEPAKRSRKLYVLWATALTLLISTALFCWLVVVPVLECRSVLSKHDQAGGLRGYYTAKSIVKTLGGPEVACPKLALFTRAPGMSSKNRLLAMDALIHCGTAALPALERLADDADEDVRGRAWMAIIIVRLSGGSDKALRDHATRMDRMLEQSGVADEEAESK